MSHSLKTIRRFRLYREPLLCPLSISASQIRMENSNLIKIHQIDLKMSNFSIIGKFLQNSILKFLSSGNGIFGEIDFADSTGRITVRLNAEQFGLISDNWNNLFKLENCFIILIRNKIKIEFKKFPIFNSDHDITLATSPHLSCVSVYHTVV
jgi:hypothetical protein